MTKEGDNEMTTPPVPSQESWDSDSFYEPRTIPGHWDISDLMKPPKLNGNGHGKQPVQAVPARETKGQDGPAPASAAKAEEPTANWQQNPFPKLKTFPAQWDLSK